jgi:hypothetical protein
MVSDWHYRTLCIEIAKRGYRTKEPEEAPRESSQILAKVFAALRKEGVGKSQIAAALNVYAEDIDALVFGLSLTGLQSRGVPRGTDSREASGAARYKFKRIIRHQKIVMGERDIHAMSHEDGWGEERRRGTACRVVSRKDGRKPP